MPLLSDQLDVSSILWGAVTVLVVRSLETPGDLTGSFTIDAQAHQLILRIDDRPVATLLIAFYSQAHFALSSSSVFSVSTAVLKARTSRSRSRRG